MNTDTKPDMNPDMNTDMNAHMNIEGNTNIKTDIGSDSNTDFNAAGPNRRPLNESRRFSARHMTAVFIALAVAVGLFHVFVMPPFMNPDEIQHFLFASNHAYPQSQHHQLDREVLDILKQHRWFHFIGVGPGWDKINKLENVYFLNYFSRNKQSVSKTYFHYLYGKALKITGIRNPVTAIYLMRLFSFLIYMGIFLLCLFFYKKHLPQLWMFLAAGQLLVYQLGTVLNSINYDVLMTLLGVLFFIAAYGFIVADEKRNIFFLVPVAALGVLTKTTGLLFFLYVLILLLFKYRLKLKFLKRFALGFFLMVIVFSWFNVWFPERFFTLYNMFFTKLRVVIGPGTGGSDTLRFLNSILDSFYFYTGWMGFRVAGPWYTALKVFLTLALTGTALHIFWPRNLRMPLFKKTTTPRSPNSANTIHPIDPTDPTAADVGRRDKQRQFLAYSAVVCLIQVSAILFYYGCGIMAQGRYLYPLLVPVLLLIYMGLTHMEHFLGLKKNGLLVSFILFQTVFFLFALIRVISVFYLEIASPHVGL